MIAKTKMTGKTIREILKDFSENEGNCGFEAYIVTKGDEPTLKRMVFSEELNSNGQSLRMQMKDIFFEIIRSVFLSEEAEYADGTQLADNQNKILIFKQENEFHPFDFLKNTSAVETFTSEDLQIASGLAICIRKGTKSIWIYQHLWEMMVPNKKRTNLMARIMRFEDETVFSEQRESILTIAKKIDLLVINGHIITSNINLLQKFFGFQKYIYQSAERAVQSIKSKDIVENYDKLTDYISRGKPKYAKKMMRIGTSKVLDMPKKALFDKISTVDRWQGKFTINPDTDQIVLNTFTDVENLIDLFDERYTRSEITNTEYDTDVKIVAAPAKQETEGTPS